MTAWVVAATEFILLLFITFSKSYSAKKGENQATKEDIGKITEIIEGIKKDLIDNTEKLKADLALKNEYLIGLTGIERDAILNYYKELYSLINYLLRLDLTIYNLDNFNDIDSVKIDIDKEFYKYDLAEGFLEFFLDTQEFIIKKFELNKSIQELGKYINISFLEYKHLFKNANIQIQFNAKPNIEIHKNLNDQTLTFLKNYYKERNEKHKPVSISSLQLKSVIKQRLNVIMTIS